ncbi:Rrp15p-domain-containing protein [Sphaerosporella brunnea]|uniref:Rrp15p-domain-containing protein n=1 Tax=Sphaerosporella brunnea TaxID=1250544 RepID=A0A5J5F2I6_9PEZI|nr:Rrp15p-domain-containing protein [Sphaerosporella brunnea]
MAPPRAQKKRKTDASSTGATTKSAKAPKIKEPESEVSDEEDKYASAESSSEEEEELDEEEEEGEDSGAESDDSISSLIAAQNSIKKKRKRNDPDAFATSMSKILGSHLTTAARKDPVLVRAKQTSDHVDEGKLEAKARRIMKDELRKEKEKGRVRDLVPKDDDVAAGRALEKERMLKSIARSGVAKLYNAVRAAQIKGEAAAKETKKEGVIGLGNREAKVTEMSKQGFLDLIQSSK